MIEYSYKNCDEDGTVIELSESRRLVRADTDGFGILLPESVLSKRYASNRTRMPPLQGVALVEAEK